MLDRSGDYSGGRWRGKVINVMDPKMQGRVQVRVVGLHDDETLIPDRDLPWAPVRMPINSGAGIRGVSASPVGVIPGTIVDGYFGDSDRTVFIVTGILLSAGKTKTGETIDGSYAIDPTYNDVANAGRGSDLNAALGLKNIVAISQIGAIFPSVSAGIGSLSTHAGDILILMSRADPYNISGAMASSVTGFTKNQIIGQLSNLASTFSGGAAGLAQALTLVQSGALSITSLPSQLQSMISGYPGGISTLISLASILNSSNPISLLNSATAAVLGQALGVASSISGGLLASLNQFTSSLGIISKRREFALQAAVPTPPPVPDTPSTTSSKASTQPSTNKEITDPWAVAQTYELPEVVINSTILERNDTVEEASVPLELTSVNASTQIDSIAENQNIMNTIVGQQNPAINSQNINGEFITITGTSQTPVFE